MEVLKSVLVIVLMGVCLLGVGCRNNGKQQVQADVNTTLFDKELPEIKKMVNGRWELVSGQNAGQTCEFENTFIEFNDDQYVWSEEGKDEPGNLNWRKAATGTGTGYDAYLMDAFYETNPSFPLAIHGDTLFIQDCTETGYKYTLIKKK